MLNTIKNHKGISLVLSVICILVLVLIVALVTDIGMLYIAKQRAQNVADAAALAGAWVMNGSDDEADANSEAQQIASDNNKNGHFTVYNASGTPGITVECPYIYTDDGNQFDAIKITCNAPVKYGFGRAIRDKEGKPLEGSSPRAETIVIRPLVTTFSYGFVPWVVADTSIWNTTANPPALITNLGDQHTLKVTNPKDVDNFIGSGNFLCVSYPGDSGAKDYENRIAGRGSPVTLITDAPMDLWTKPGNMTGPTDKGIQDRLSQDTHFTDNATAWSQWLSTYDSESGTYTDTPRIVITPIVKDPGGDLSGHKQLTVVGFAAFFIESYSKKDEQVVGRFLSATTYGDIIRWGFGSFGDETNLLSTIRMVK